MVKKHTKPNPQMGIAGGELLNRKLQLHLSNCIHLESKVKRAKDKIKYSTDTKMEKKLDYTNLTIVKK